MSKLQGLVFLQNQFEFNGQQMAQLLLYKNVPAEKLETYQLGLAKMLLVAMECRDLHWALSMIRQECEHGLAGFVPQGYDPFVDLDGDWLPEARPYDVYAEMGYYLRPDDTPHGLGMDLSPAVLDAVGPLVLSRRAAHAHAAAQGERLMRRDGDEGPFRPMTDQEVARHRRGEETELLEGCAFTVGFNADMARLRQLVAERGSLGEIMELIGPAAPPPDDRMPF